MIDLVPVAAAGVALIILMMSLRRNQRRARRWSSWATLLFLTCAGGSWIVFHQNNRTIMDGFFQQFPLTTAANFGVLALLAALCWMINGFISLPALAGDRRDDDYGSTSSLGQKNISDYNGLNHTRGGADEMCSSLAPTEFFAMVLFFLTASILMINAADFMALYLSMELQSMTVYVLLGLNRHNAKAAEANMTYFIMSALASAIFLYGVSLLYGLTGTVNYSTMAAILHNGLQEQTPMTNPTLYLAMLLVLGGIVFKLSLAPFHMWTVDTYQGAPLWTVSLLATVSKLVGATVLAIVLMQPFADLAYLWHHVFIIFGAGSLVMGSFSALAEKSLLRLLGFSAIANMGFVALGFAMGLNQGLQQGYIYLIIYLISTLGIFSLLLEARYRLAHGHFTISNLDDLAGFAKIDPVWSLMMALLLFSQTGLPPLAGFFAKLHIIIAMIDANHLILAVVAVLLSVLGAFYYLKIVKAIYFDPPASDYTPLKEAVIFKPTNLREFLYFRLPSTAAVAFVVLYVFAPNSLVNYIMYIFTDSLYYHAP